jgi:hypothetical protein
MTLNNTKPTHLQAHFIFSNHTMPKLKNKKSLQANAQGQCKLDTTDLRPKRSPACNRGFALWGLTSFVETLVHGSTFVVRMNSSDKNPPQRKAPKRWWQFWTTATRKNN